MSAGQVITIELPETVQPDTLRSADTPLGRARVARGWSQAKAVRAMTLLAEHWGWVVASESSLKIQISGWEQGSRRPGETYQRLFCALYRTTPEALGFTQAAPARGLRAKVEELEGMLAQLKATLAATGGAA